MNTHPRQFANSGAQPTAASTTKTSTSQELPNDWNCFEADLFELQLDASPSLALRSRIAGHLSGVVSFRRVKHASRFRLLHWMLEQERCQAQRDREIYGVAH